MLEREILGVEVKALFGWLFAAGLAVSCATEEAEPLAVTQQAQGVDQCVTRGGTQDCPDEFTGECGSWACGTNLLIPECLFTVSRAGLSGAECQSEITPSGVCGPYPASGNNPAFVGCCGCFSRDACYPGNTVSFCGIRGSECERCGPCQTCKDGACVATDEGVSCGTCMACSGGQCVPQAPGTQCANGRCAADAICCSGCRDENDKCVTSTDEHCGSGGNVCAACGQCQTCSSTGACQARTGTCNDNDACTAGDTCTAGACSGTAIPPCDDGNPCTNDACSATSGCVFTSLAENAGCDDGNTCSTGDRCTDHDSDTSTPRVCRATGGTLCDDPPTPCRATQCSGGSCPYPNLPDGTGCSTNDRCVINEACDTGDCVGEPRVCDDDNECTTDSCESTGSGSDIDPATGCRFVPNTDDCDDGNLCTVDDACGDGSCAGTLKSCPAPNECFQDGSCDPGTGDCIFALQPDGTQCETTGQCQSGSCDGGTPTGGGAGGGGDGGAPGTAGEGNGAIGGTGTAGVTGTSGEGNEGGEGTGGTAGNSGAASGELFKRDPGGCACRAPGGTGPGGSAQGLLWLSLAMVVAGRRRLVTRRGRRSNAA